MSKIITAEELAPKYIAYQHERHDHPEKHRLLSSGLRDLDGVIGGGYERGQYVGIAGTEKAGKTTLLMKHMRAIADQNINTLMFSNEMRDMQIGTMLFSTLTRIERTKIRAMGLEIADWELLDRAGEKIAKLTLSFDFGTFDIDAIPDAIHEVEAKTGERVEAVGLDYFHLMDDPDFKGNSVDKFSSNSLKFKRWTFLDDIARLWLVAVHLNREASKANIVATNYFLGTGQLERDFDIAEIISKIKDPVGTSDEFLPFIRRMSVVLSRETDIGDCNVFFNGATATLADLADESGRPPRRSWE